MTRRFASLFLVAAALAAGCGKSQTAQRKDQNYQVVQEGQASGVTSTINAPGETTPPMTNTGVDTTTNLTLLDNPAPMGTQGTSNIAGTLPQTATNTPRTVPSSTMPPMSSATTPSAPVTTDTVAATATQPQPRHRSRPPQTDTTATQAPPPTDTTSTQAPPPPPPPPTDTTKTDTTKTDTGPPPKTDTTKTDTQQQTKTDTTSTEKPPV